MKRQRTETALRALLVAVLLLAFFTTAAAQTPPAAARRPNRYGREGAEIWIEAPRVMFPTGGGYRNGVTVAEDQTANVDLKPGLGFGFGIFFAVSDNLLFEGRMMQSVHRVDAVGETEDRDWDLDQAYVGVRYVFRYEEKVQPSIGAGALRYSLEWNEGLDDFVRLTGYGGYVSAGVDYMLSRTWVLMFRTEYSVMQYGGGLFGTDEFDFDEGLDGSGFGLSLGLSYRIPMW